MLYNGTYLWVQNGQDIVIGSLDEYGEAVRDSMVKDIQLGRLHILALGVTPYGELTTVDAEPIKVMRVVTHSPEDVTITLTTSDGHTTSQKLWKEYNPSGTI